MFFFCAKIHVMLACDKAVKYDDNLINSICLSLVEDSVHNTAGITTCSTMLPKEDTFPFPNFSEAIFKEDVNTDVRFSL